MITDLAHRASLLPPPGAFDHPVTVGITIAIAALLVATPLVILALGARGKLDPKLCTELWRRYLSWLVLAPLIVVPVLLGPAFTIGAVTLLALGCYREFSRATGLFRERTIHAVVVAGILLLAFATLDRWYGLFMALLPLVVGTIAVAGLAGDRPQGYLQRSALGIFGFTLFGCALFHLGYMANDPGYRPLVLTVLLAVELNDVFAFVTGKALGRRKLVPNISPGKTVAGALGALLLTTALVAWIGHHLFAGTKLDTPLHLVLLGVIVSAVGQLGDLMLSAIKRDLGIKDTGVLIPGHGGLLDRFDSLLLVAPAVFHFVHYHVGLAVQEAAPFGGG